MEYIVSCYFCGQHGAPDRLYTNYYTDDAEDAQEIANRWEEQRDDGIAEISERHC